MKRFLSFLLAFCMAAGLLPVPGQTASVTALSEELKALDSQSRAAAQVIDASAVQFEKAAAAAAALQQEGRTEDDGEWQYVLLPDSGYAVITGHHDQGDSALSIPFVLGGGDVVALLGGVFDGHINLDSVTVTGNIYYAAPDAFPRGTTLCGYHGSYAESWAYANGHAFVNLSELDFAPGAIDMSDVNPAYFTRHDANHITLRQLEAYRLQPGSVFFLADPDNLYAVSFYRVASITRQADGMADIRCETPEISSVLNSFELTNAPMVADWDTLKPAEDVQMLTNQSRDSSNGTSSVGFHFKPKFKLGSKGNLEFDIGYDISSTVSASYAHFQLDTMELQNTENYVIGGKVEYGSSLYSDEEGQSADDLLKALRAQAKKTFVAQDVQKTSKPLGSVMLFSLYGVLNVSMEIEFNVEYAGSVELTVKYTTETTYTYKDDKLVSKSAKRGHTVEIKAEAEVKVGLSLNLKLKIFAADIASLGVFAGVKGTLSKTLVNITIPDDDTKTSAEIFQDVVSNVLSIASLNMMDCLDLDINLVVELKASISIGKLELIGAKYTLIDIPLLNLHLHTCPLKFGVVAGQVMLAPKDFKDILHDADRCTMSDSVQLMVPELSKTKPMGSVQLFGYAALTKAPVLELPEAHVRVTRWYTDENLLDPIDVWHTLSLESGDRIYGKADPVNLITIVGYDGQPLKKKNGSDATYFLGEGETLTSADLNLEDAEHIVGWVEVENASNLKYDKTQVTESLSVSSDGEDHTYLAIRNNDLTVIFRDSAGKEIRRIVTGHFIELVQSLVPAFPVLYDPEIAIATYEWRGDAGAAANKVIEFPYTADSTIGDTLSIVMNPTGIQRVFETTDAPSDLGSQPGRPDGVTTYSSKDYFNYRAYSNYVEITGFRADQRYVDEEGFEHKWTAVPESLIIPAYIDDKPVTAIASGAFNNLETLVSVVLPSTITSIGNYAFLGCAALENLDISACTSLTALPDDFAAYCSSLTGIYIPGSVTSLGSRCFIGCTSLQSADINASIGSSAFEGCTALSSVTLRTRVSSIGNNAFLDCTALKTLYVPCSVQTVGDNFIKGCTALTSLTFDGAPSTITRGTMYIGEGSQLATLNLELGVLTIGENAFSNHPNLTTIKLPEALREVGRGALNGTAVEKLTIYDLGMLGTGFAANCQTLKELTFETGRISDYAFDGCTHLEKITMGDGVYAIGNYAFRDCKALTSVTFGSGVRSVGRYAFYNCTGLTKVITGGEVENIGESAFDGCTALTSINLGDVLKTVGGRAFRNCSTLEELYFPPSVESIGNQALTGCSGLKTLSIGGPNTPVLDGNEWWWEISNSQLETIIVNEGVEELGNYCFSSERIYGYLKNLKHVSLPSTLTSIGDYAFRNATALTDLTLPSSLKHIGSNAFFECSSLTLNCPDDLELESIGNTAFGNCISLTDINLGHSLKTVAARAFSGCYSLTELHFPPSVESIGNQALIGCSGLKTLSIGGPNTPVLDGNEWWWEINNSQLETIIVNEGVEELGNYCFSSERIYGYLKNLKHVSLPSTLVSIGSYAFANASSLTDLTLPSSLKHIGSRAFFECRNLTLNCPDDLELESIGDTAFGNCVSLNDINLGHSLKTVAARAFSECYALTELHFPPSVESIGNQALIGCSGLKTLSIGGPNTPVLDGNEWWWEISNSQLETIIVNEGVEELDSYCFSSERIFGYLKNLKHVSLPSTLVSIGSYAFANASSLTDLTLPSSLKHIGSRAFFECRNLTLNCPDDLELESIGDSAFGNCVGLTDINLGHSLKTVAARAFSECYALTELHFPPSVESIGNQVLIGCSGLKTLSIGGPNTPVLDGNEWWWEINNSQLETIIVNEGVEELDSYCFSSERIYGYLKNLKHVSLPSTLVSIGSYAFANAYSLTDLTLPSGITTISSDAFSGSGMTNLHSAVYSEVIDAYAQSHGVSYTYDAGTVTVTLMDGETVLYTGEMAIGESLSSLLADAVPADHDGTTFDGWHLNPEGTMPWAPDVVPTFDLTIYARMVPVHTAVFTLMHSGSATQTIPVTVGEGHRIPWPEEPVVSGYRFAGWFTDAAMTQAFSADAVMGSADVTIYGLLTAKAAGTVYVPAEGGVALQRYVLSAGESTDVWLPTTVNGQPLVGIMAGAFDDAPQVTRLHLPDQLAWIGENVLTQIPELTWITTGPDCRNYKAVNGILYAADMGTLLCLPQRKPLTTLTLPAGVHTIAKNACANHAWLQTVSLGDQVNTLEDGAFAGCVQLTSFTAQGLTSIGAQALPVNPELMVYGPVKTGPLRDYYLLQDGTAPVFSVSYNLYFIDLYLNRSKVSTIGLEAGSMLPADFLYGEQDEGIVVHTWYTDADMTAAWDPSAPTPAADMRLYAPNTPIYAYETVDFIVGDATVRGIRLTAYNGVGGALTLPTSINGLPVMSLGESFLASARGNVASVQISSEIIEIADTALVMPDDCTFGGIVLAPEGSYAAQWAEDQGYQVNRSIYTLSFAVNGGGSIAPRKVSAGTDVKLPTPIKTGCTFLGWYTDAKLTTPVDLTDGCFNVPAADTTLYAAWEGTAAVWPFTWQEYENGIMITAYSGSEQNVIIPESINGRSVTAIADGAFADAAIHSVTLPSAMNTIGKYAFSGSSLTSIDLGGTKTVGTRAFDQCASLQTVTMTAVTTLGSDAFSDCIALTALTIPASMQTIAATAFNGCRALTSFAAEENSLYIANDGILYEGTTLLRYPPARKDTAFTLPDTTEAISPHAFSGAASLQTLTLCDSLTSIGAYAFTGCSGLTGFSTEAAPNVTVIPESAFSGCTALKSVQLGSSIQHIDASAFAHCSSLREITISKETDSIDALAFLGVPAQQLTIIGAFDSAAHAHAISNGIVFADPDAEPVTGLTIAYDEPLYAGKVVELTAAIEPAGAALGGEIVWSSSKPEIVYIYDNQAHLLTGGDSVITATAPNGVQASVTITVHTPCIDLSAASATLVIGQTVQVAVIMPEDCPAVDCIWNSTAPEVIRAVGSTLTALTEGQATINCQTAFGQTLAVDITVVPCLSTAALPAALTSIDKEAFLGMAAQRVLVNETTVTIADRAFADNSALRQLILPASVQTIAPDALEGSGQAVVLCAPGSAAQSYAEANQVPYLYILP